MIRAYGGLCNRIRVVLSYRARFKRVQIVWHPDGEIASGRWSDVFAPLPGVEFLDEGDYHTATIDPYPDAPVSWPETYRELRLLPALHPFLPPAPYSAMHIRRTDCVEMAKRDGVFTTDEAFVKWCKVAPCDAIWVATDNGTTQRQMMAAIADRGRAPLCHLTIPEHADQDGGGRRNTTLEHAAVDLFACVRAQAFMGSGASSFTNTVEIMRALGCTGKP